VSRLITALAVLLALPLQTSAAVRFADWSPENVPGLLAEAAASETLVMLVITQPDWCPGCIELDRQLLRNPAATEVAELTRDWLVLEVYGYDEPDAGFLAAQGISFLGTPTTLLLKPEAGRTRLGEARQLAAIVGLPGDYLEQLAGGAMGRDAIAAAQAQLRERNDVESLQVLARAFLAAGDAGSARRVYRSLLLRDELTAEERRDIALQMIIQATQRVEKDHRRALEELDAWAEAFPAETSLADYVYARAWSLLALGEEAEAMALIRAAYLESDDPDDLAQYLFLAFRYPIEPLLGDAEVRAREGIGRFPAQAARFNAALGRILRRQGRLEEAEAAFERAVSLAGEAHPSYGTYLGQLEFVRNERAAAPH
jgi:tetratricopeptide (TPR) repeat protein